MRIWMPYVWVGSGADVFTHRLAQQMRDLGHEVVEQEFPHRWQFFPWRMRLVAAPPGTDITVATTHTGFAFHRASSKLVVVEHGFVLDPAFAPYRSTAQTIYHEVFVRHFTRRSIEKADAIVAVSDYTARVMSKVMNINKPYAIHNGVDTEFFCPDLKQKQKTSENEPFELLFVGNLIRRKGADLLPRIMERLGPAFVLRYTSGLRTHDSSFQKANMKPLGRLDQQEARAAYRNADALLFPTRMEGFGLVAAEAMACETPVIATNCTALPEVIDDGVTGRLCPLDDVDAFAAAIRDLAADRERLREMGKRARAAAVERFDIQVMARKYDELFRRLDSKR